MIAYVGIDAHTTNYTLATFKEHSNKPINVNTYSPKVSNIEKYCKGLRKQFGQDLEIVLGYEAGCLGFKLKRDLDELGLNTVVMAPASIPGTDLNRKRRRNKNDRRSETDADYSVKTSYYYDKNGIRKSKKSIYYGFRKHTLVDAMTELPIASLLLPASKDEKKAMTQLLPTLPGIIKKRGKYATFDRGYDSNEFLQTVKDTGRKPIIDNRKLRKGDPLTEYGNNIFYTESGIYFL